MKLIKLVFVSSIMWFGLTTLNAQYTEVMTLAGSGSKGFADGTGTAASFNGPSEVAVDGSGNVYVADSWNHLIRKITSAGVVTTFAGTAGSKGSADGTGTAASFNGPTGVAIDGSGNVYVADKDNHLIRKITSAGVVTTFAGSGSGGSTNGTGTAASFYFPQDVAVDGSGNVYVGEEGNHLIRKITSVGVVTTLAGSGSKGSADGTGTAASFNNPMGVAVDGSGNVYVAERSNHLIRKITSAGVVTTLAGSGSQGSADGTGTAASFNEPHGVAVDDDGNVYIGDYSNHRIRKITSAGVVTTLAGSGSQGSADGTSTAASFRSPLGVAVDGSGNVYVGEHNNHLIRKIFFPPSPFDLVYPPNNTTIILTRANFLDTLYFAWNQSSDTQPVTYRRELTGDLPEYIRFIVESNEQTTTNMYKVPYHHIEDYMHEAGVELISGTWTIVATDGTYDTYPANGPFSLTIDGSQLNIADSDIIPETFALHGNYPNPFNPTTTITYDLPEQAQVTLGIYDLLGKKIKTLVNQSQDAGNKLAVWDGTDYLGRQVSAGIYLYQIQVGEFSQTRKMLLLK
jgi:sugar lactone lactonase YvrE